MNRHVQLYRSTHPRWRAGRLRYNAGGTRRQRGVALPDDSRDTASVSAALWRDQGAGANIDGKLVLLAGGRNQGAISAQ